MKSDSRWSANILVLATSGIGNMVNATPLLASLRDAYPHAPLTVVGAPRGTAEVITGSGLADAVLVARKRLSGTDGLLATARRLRARRVSHAFISWASHGLFSNALAWLAGAPVRVGYRSRGDWLLTHRLHAARARHEVELNRDLLRCVCGSCSIHGTSFAVRDEDRRVARQLLAKVGAFGSRLAAIHAGSYADMPEKRWPPESYARLIDKLGRELGLTVVLVGGPEESTLADAIATRSEVQPVVLVGQLSLKETAAVLEQADVAIANCSGLMHIAAAVGTPVVAVYGPTDWRVSGPYGEGHEIVRLGLACSPCYREDSVGKRIRCDEDYACLKGLQVSEVYQAVGRLLRARYPDGGPRASQESCR